MLTSTYHHLAIIEHDICQPVLFDRIRGNGRYNKIYNHQNFLSKLLTLYRTFFGIFHVLGSDFGQRTHSQHHPPCLHVQPPGGLDQHHWRP